jgi:mercuric ion transport protein
MNGKQTLFASVLAAIGASACCVGPLVLLSLGIGGAWVSSLTQLEPLRPIFVGLTVVLLAMAWRKLHRAPACVPGQVCADPKIARLQKLLFWLVAPLLLGLITSPWIIPLFV